MGLHVESACISCIFQLSMSRHSSKEANFLLHRIRVAIPLGGNVWGTSCGGQLPPSRLVRASLPAPGLYLYGCTRVSERACQPASATGAWHTSLFLRRVRRASACGKERLSLLQAEALLAAKRASVCGRERRMHGK